MLTASTFQHLAAQLKPEIIAIRRHLHAHPELSFQEYATSAYIRQLLDTLQIPYEQLADTGIVARIEGKNPHNKTVALRADMDALPITEKNDVPYCSTNEGVMHACGHDAHSAALLGAAAILNQLRHRFEGTIRLIFQPAEERAPGGASLMIKEGVLENPEPFSIVGQHVHPLLPVGKVGFRAGKMMASADEIRVVVRGKGGHGAVPQLTIDPIAVSAQLLTALQQLVSRQADPTVPSVLTFGSIHSTGGTYNIIPDEVVLEGTFRTMDEEWRFEAHRKMVQIAQNVAEAFGATCQFDITVGYPFLVNDEAVTARCRAAAEQYLGKENVVELPLRMTAEDFAYYTHRIAGCFYRLGTGNIARGITSQVHTPTFDIDEDSLEIGAGLMAWLAVSELNAR